MKLLEQFAAEQRSKWTGIHSTKRTLDCGHILKLVSLS